MLQFVEGSRTEGALMHIATDVAVGDMVMVANAENSSALAYGEVVRMDEKTVTVMSGTDARDYARSAFQFIKPEPSVAVFMEVDSSASGHPLLTRLVLAELRSMHKTGTDPMTLTNSALVEHFRSRLAFSTLSDDQIVTIAKIAAVTAKK